MENDNSHQQTQEPRVLKTIQVTEKAHEILHNLANDEGIEVADVIEAAINSLNFQVKLIAAMEKELKQRGIFHKFKAKWKNQLVREAQAEKSKIVQLSREIQLPTETVPSGIVIP